MRSRAPGGNFGGTVFERFTDRARRAVVLAQEEARGLDHNYIGTEHLLVGLLREEEGIAAQALLSFDLDAETAIAEIQRRIGRGSVGPKGHIPFTPRAKKVLELALREALRLRHNYIGTEHVLLGLIREGEGVAAQIIISRIEGGLDAVRDTVAGLLGDPAEPLEEKLGEVSRTVRRRFQRLGSELSVSPPDEIRKRLEAIEARLSVIEQLLRGQRGEEEVS